MKKQHKFIFGLIFSEMDSVSHNFTCGHVKHNQHKRHKSQRALKRTDLNVN